MDAFPLIIFEWIEKMIPNFRCYGLGDIFLQKMFKVPN